MQASVAVVLRGDRGLEQFAKGGKRRAYGGCGRPSGRSRIGTHHGKERYTEARRLRSSFGAIEDWNTISIRDRKDFASIRLRSSFGAIEDWNYISTAFPDETGWVAVVLRGDRGLELHLNRFPRRNRMGCGRPSGRSRIGTDIPNCAAGLSRCGRPSGRSRIGTLRHH